jgi:peptidoglycan-associated lipoprotein
MNAALSTSALVAAALTLAACASKPKELPAPPPATARPEAPPAPAPAPEPAPAPTAPAFAPGSQEALRADAGTDTVLFAYDSYELSADAKAVLIRHAAWLRANPAVKVTLEGHCDERGTREYNLALGDRRANAAKNFLASLGIETGRLATISYGKERPAVDGSDEAALAQNRRAVTMVAR